MSAARTEVLRRIGAALGPAPAVPEIPRAYHRAGARPVDVERFCERVADYRATVHRVSGDELGALLDELCAGRRLGIAPEAPWRPSGAELVVDDGLPASELDGLDGALTGCALGIAESGTIVLDAGARSGRRALSLVPDLHVCVVEEGQVVAGMPDAIAALQPAAREGRPLTFVSGPSATSDIELERVEGVHGPRELVVVVVAGGSRGTMPP